MKPKNNGNGDYEKVKIDEWLTGEIEEVQYEENHEFTGQFAKVAEAVRFKFKLDGYQQPHYSRWMIFSYSEKSNLFKKYVSNFVEGAHEYFDFDIQNLKGLKIKVMYSETISQGKTFQNIELIKAIKPVKYESQPLPEIQLEHEEESPF